MVLLLRGEIAGEFAGPVRVDEIIAFGVDDINRVAQTRRLPDAVERRAHIDIDDNDAERFAVRSLKLGGDAQRRHVRDLDSAVFLIQIQGRHIYFVRLQAQRALEIGPIRLFLEFGIGHQAD